MKEKKPSWLERYEARQRDQVTISNGVVFTPGVPTEDGWYVCKWGYDYSKEVNGPPMEIYHTIQIKHGHMMFDSACDIHEEAQLHHYTILSHAKLPEL